jgi:hypothetical protein
MEFFSYLCLSSKKTTAMFINPIQVWFYFASEGIQDDTKLSRADILIQVLRNESVFDWEALKDSAAYRGCASDLPGHLLTEDYLKKIYEELHP